MDNSEGTDYGNGGRAGLREQRGGKWDNCNSINNKIFLKYTNTSLYKYIFQQYSI